MRLFISIDFSQAIKEEIWLKMSYLREKFPQISWTPRENLHLTFVFIGDTIPEDADKITHSLETCCEKSSGFSLSFDRLDYFDREQFIVYLSFGPSKKVQTLVHLFKKELQAQSFMFDDKPFRAHITLGRGKRLNNAEKILIKTILDKPQRIAISQVVVSEVSLMESQLSPLGPTYILFQTFKLLGKHAIIG